MSQALSIHTVSARWAGGITKQLTGPELPFARPHAELFLSDCSHYPGFGSGRLLLLSTRPIVPTRSRQHDASSGLIGR